MAEIGHDAQVRRNGPDAPDAAIINKRGQLIEHPVEIHEIAFGLGFADAHPFGVPGVVERVAGLGKQVTGPRAVVQHAQNGRGLAPARGKQRVAVPLAGGGVLLAGDLDKGVALDYAPPGAVPFAEAA